MFLDDGILTDLLDLVFPRYCIVCGKRLLPAEKYICLGCCSDIPFTYLWDRPDAWVLSLFHYNDVSPYRKLALSVKYSGNAGLGVRMGRLLGIRAALSPCGWKGIDVVAPVPLHWTRQWKRGYNQAGKIAEGFVSGYVSAGGGEPVLLPVLFKRSRRTRSQTTMAVERKVSNVGKAFVLGSDSGRLEALIGKKGHVSVLLVDDTCTTGATLLSCSSVLKAYGASVTVSYATMAKVRED